MANRMYSVYIVIQDASQEDLDVIFKYDHIVTEILYTKADGLNVEELINRNRLLAWEVPLILKKHQYVICLEDDVEVSSDIFDFTEKVLEQNSNSKKFRGINFGSFEKPMYVGSYSKMSYGLHGPASLISKKSFKKFQLNLLKRFRGKIPWDAWIEPIVKRGYVVTSNVARYRDNGIVGTHATLSTDYEYFRKLNESFEYGKREKSGQYWNIDIRHTWRNDCKIYKKGVNAHLYVIYLVIRVRQISNLIKKH